MPPNLQALASCETTLTQSASHLHRTVNIAYRRGEDGVTPAVFYDSNRMVSVVHGVDAAVAYSRQAASGKILGVLTLTVGQVHAAAVQAGTTTRIVDDSGCAGVPSDHTYIDMRHMSRQERARFRDNLLDVAQPWRP